MFLVITHEELEGGRISGQIVLRCSSVSSGFTCHAIGLQSTRNQVREIEES